MYYTIFCRRGSSVTGWPPSASTKLSDVSKLLGSAAAICAVCSPGALEVWTAKSPLVAKWRETVAKSDAFATLCSSIEARKETATTISVGYIPWKSLGMSEDDIRLVLTAMHTPTVPITAANVCAWSWTSPAVTSRTWERPSLARSPGNRRIYARKHNSTKTPLRIIFATPY